MTYSPTRIASAFATGMMNAELLREEQSIITWLKRQEEECELRHLRSKSIQILIS
jgi:hypothetical protein